MNGPEKQELIELFRQQRADSLAAERLSVPPVTAAEQAMTTPQLFAAAFGHSRAERLAATAPDDDTPRPPEAPPPAPTVPPEETRARQTSMSAEDLFASLQAKLTATPERVNLPPDIALRRAFRELPGSDRERIAATIEAQDFGLPGYFNARGFGDDYTSLLVGSALARRYADARRLQPDLTPAELLRQMAQG